MSTEIKEYWVDLSLVRDRLAAYSPDLRVRAIQAIDELSARVRGILRYASPETSWLNSEREGPFEIAYEAFAEGFVVIRIEVATTSEVRREGAFVLRRAGGLQAIRSRGGADGPSAVLASHRFVGSDALLLALGSAHSGTLECFRWPAEQIHTAATAEHCHRQRLRTCPTAFINAPPAGPGTHEEPWCTAAVNSIVFGERHTCENECQLSGNLPVHSEYGHSGAVMH